MVRDLAADRTHQEAGEPAAAAGPHDEQVGVTGSLDEFFGHISGDRAHGELGYGHADFAGDLVCESLNRRLREL